MRGSDFIEQLEAAVLALRSSLDARGLARAARSSATQGVGSEIALGRRVVMIMDATLTRVLRSQPTKLAEWEHVKRVTLKGVAVRGSVGGVEESPSLVESSAGSFQGSQAEVVGSPTSVTKAA